MSEDCHNSDNGMYPDHDDPKHFLLGRREKPDWLTNGDLYFYSELESRWMQLSHKVEGMLTNLEMEWLRSQFLIGEAFIVLEMKRLEFQRQIEADDEKFLRSMKIKP